MRWWLALGILASGSAAAGELMVTPGTPVAATIDGRAARLLVGSGGLDRLTLDGDYVAANGIKPATLIGGAECPLPGGTNSKGITGR